MTTPRRIAIALELDKPYPHHQDVYAGVLHYAQDQPAWACYLDEYPDTGKGSMLSGEADYDGVIARTTPSTQRNLKRLGIPLVNIHYQHHRRGVAGVYPDHDFIGRGAAEHLIGLGVHRLCFITDKIHKSSVNASKAFARHAQEEQVPCAVSYIAEPSYDQKRSWLKMKKELMDLLTGLKPPVGVYISTASMARVLIQLAQANGWNVPRDMAVLSARHIPSIVEVSPTISTYEIDWHRIGYRAGELLDRLIDGGPTPDEPLLIAHGELIARESTDYRVVADPVVAEALHYIADHLQDRLTIIGIAYALNVSPRLLQQRFAEHLGVGASDEIRRLRLEKAKRLLAEPDRLITSIPPAVGLNSANAMNKLFIRELGMTPSAYRRQILSDRLYSPTPKA
ncbi:MAG: substrate-binding domain-containing protein [Phycisphaeraceae bacterium]